MEPCEKCKWYNKDEVDITCYFCRGEYRDRWEPKDNDSEVGIALVNDRG